MSLGGLLFSGEEAGGGADLEERGGGNWEEGGRSSYGRIYCMKEE